MLKIKTTKRKGIALILTLGIIFMLGLITGSFTYFTTTSSQSTKQYLNSIAASGMADSGANLMIGAMREYFDMMVPAVILSKGIDVPEVAYTPPADNLASLKEKITAIKNAASLNNKVKLCSDELNQIQAALTRLLSGERVEFSKPPYSLFIKNAIITKLLDKVDYENPKLYTDEAMSIPNPNLGLIQEWALKYGIKIDWNADAAFKYQINLDGLNKYKAVADQKTFAETLLKTTIGCFGETSSNTNDLKGFITTQYGKSPLNKSDANQSSTEGEMGDADWHLITENSHNVGRFAVMAKDRSSRINLLSPLGAQGVADITHAALNTTVDGKNILIDRTLLSANLTNQNTNELNIETLLGDKNVLDTFYTTSTVSTSLNDFEQAKSREIDLNMADRKDLFMYFTENIQKSSTNALQSMRGSAQATANIGDYMDDDNIPNLVSVYNWTGAEVASKNPYAFNASTATLGMYPSEIYMGQEGVRISEVMIMPEQSYKFGKDEENAKFSLTAGIKNPTSYFYNATATSIVNGQIEEKFRCSERYIDEVIPDVSQNTKSELTLDANGMLSLSADNQIAIRNPGGAYQVWLKMKVNAKPPAADSEKISKNVAMYGSATEDGAHIVVDSWDSGSDGSYDTIINRTYGSLKNLENLGYRTNLWEDVVDSFSCTCSGTNSDGTSYSYSCTTYSTVGEREKTFVEAYGTRTLKEIYEIPLWTGDAPSYHSNTEGNNLTRKPHLNFSSRPSRNAELPMGINPKIVLFSKSNNAPLILNNAMNIGHNPSSDITSRPDVTLNYFSAVEQENKKSIALSITDLQKIAQGKDDAGNPKPLAYDFGTRVVEVSMYDDTELIGKFYCVNTDNFRENPADNSMWFYSVGVPAWTDSNEIPSWMHKRMKEGETQPAYLADANAATKNPKSYSNLCVFPRDKCKLKFKFRLVDMSAAQFNMDSIEETQLNYQKGVNSLKINNKDINTEEKLQNFNLNHAIVGRPQWNNGDSVEIELSEMVITQQGYSTSLKENVYKADGTFDKADVKTYNEITGIKKLKEEIFPPYGEASSYDALKSVIKGDASTDFLNLRKIDPIAPNSKKSLYYRNQRLENRDANELHAGEYVELFNGTSKPVNLDGWVMKIEQYKKFKYANGLPILHAYYLLGPAEPYNSNVKPADVQYGRPDYVYLTNGTIPSAALGKDSVPYALITNGRQKLEYDSSTKSFNVKHTKDFNSLNFEYSYDPVLGKTEAPQPFEEKLGKVESLGSVEEKKDENGKSYIEYTPTDSMRSKPFGTGTDYKRWYECEASEQIDYQTFNLVYGRLIAGSSGYCDTFKIESASSGTYIKTDPITVDVDNLTEESVIEKLLEQDNPFLNENPIFKDEELGWVGFKATYKSGETYVLTDGWKDKFKALLLPKGTWKIPDPTDPSKTVDYTGWKFDYYSAKERARLIKKVWPKHAELIIKKIKSHIAKGDADQYSEDSAVILTFPWQSLETVYTEDDVPAIANTDGQIRDLLKIRQDVSFAGKDYPSNSIINENFYLDEKTKVTEYNFFPNGFEGSAICASNHSSYIYAYIPIRFAAKREKTAIGNSEALAVFDINFKTIWNYQSKSNQELNFIDTYNIPHNLDTSDYKIVNNTDEQYTVKGLNNNPMGINPLHLRDDADRIIITLFAPKNPSKAKIKLADLPTFSKYIYKPVTDFKPDSGVFCPGTAKLTEYSSGNFGGLVVYNTNLRNGHNYNGKIICLGLVDEQEWISGYRTDDVDKLPCESYGIVDRAVLDRDVINIMYKLNKLPKLSGIFDCGPIEEQKGYVGRLMFNPNPDLNPENKAYKIDPFRDWWGGNAIALNTFFTDSLLLRKGITGSIDNNDPFNGESGNQLPINLEGSVPPYMVYFKKTNRITMDGGANFDYEGNAGHMSVETVNLYKPFIESADALAKPDTIQNTNNIARLCARYWETHKPVFKEKLGPVTTTDPATTPASSKDVVLIASGSPGLPNYKFDRIEDSEINKTTATHDKDNRINVPEISDTDAPTIEALETATKDVKFKSGIKKYDYANTIISGGAATVPTKDLSESEFYNLQEKGFGDNGHKYPTFKDTECFIKDAPLESISELCNIPGPGVQYAQPWDDPYTVGTYIRTLANGLEGIIEQYNNEMQKQKIFSSTKVDTFVLHFAGENTTSDFNYKIDCVGKNARLYPGKYKMFISGLDAAVVGQIKIATNNDDGNTDIKRGGVIINLSGEGFSANNQTIDTSDPDKKIQLKNDVNNSEIFNITESISVNISVQSAITNVKTDYRFNKLNLYLMPIDKLERVNLNTAPIEVLLKLPGLCDAIDPSVPKLKQTAAQQVLRDIVDARAGTLKHTFSSAGDFLTFDFNPISTDPEHPTPKRRIFPLTIADEGVTNDITSTNTGVTENVDKLRTYFVEYKLNIFKRLLPYIQFNSDTYEIISVGQILKPNVPDTDKPVSLASSKVEMTIDLKSLLTDIMHNYVYDAWDDNDSVVAVP